MNPSRLFIERPIATLLLTLAVILSGLLAFFRLSISALPEVDYPVIQVSAQFPGAGPDIMTRTVTAPLERRLGQIAGLSQMYSVTSGGASSITLKFNLDVSLDVAEQEVQAAINGSDSLLPSDLPMKPTYKKVNPADAPILTLAATSETIPMIRVQDLLNTRVALRLSQVSGVGLVTLAGGQQTSVRIEVNPTKLASYGLTLSDISSTISRQNVNGSKGGFDGPERSITIDANDQLRDAQAYADLILKYSNGQAVRLGDVARVTHAPQNAFQEARANGKPAILVNVQRQPGTNVVSIADAIKAQLPQIQADLPASVKLEILSDRTGSIRAAIDDVEIELLISIALVIVVSFLFLRTFGATIIPGTAVPLSVIGTFAVMYFAGFSLNNLTLMALTIATGFVIDDAIVVVENIMRHIENGMEPREAALKGAGEIGFTIVSLTVSLIAVLIPLLFMSDVVGRLFREFSITLAVAIFVSMLVSLTLTPMLCAQLLRPVSQKREGPLGRALEAAFSWLLRGYERMLRVVLRHQVLTLFVAVSSLVLTAVLYLWIPKGFFPMQDTGVIQVTVEAESNISFDEMVRRQQSLAEVLRKDPAVASVTSVTGIDGTNTMTMNSGRMQLILRDFGDRDRAERVIERLHEAAAVVPGVRLYAVSNQDLNVDEIVTPSTWQLSLMSTDRGELERWSARLVAAMRNDPAFADVHCNLGNNARELFLEIDRTAASRYGISASDITTALYNAYGQRQISTIYTQANQYRVVLEVAPEFRDSPDRLSTLYLKGASGKPVPLTDMVRVSERSGYSQYARLRQAPAAVISFNPSGETTIESARAAVRQALADIGMPETVALRFQGAMQAYESASTSTLWLILAAVVTMYIVLGILYESLIHPVTVLSTLPSAAIGALIALKCTGSEFDMIALIGIILLIGIVKKNAIMLIDFAIEERKTGKSAQDAVFSACLLRFRPILMTTFAALFGAIPLLLASGAGSELRVPLGLVIIAGLALSQLITLFTTPVIYIAFERLAGRGER